MLNRLTDAIDFHGNALALRSQRQQLLASNIANADTPNYQARELDFGNALRDATAAGRGGPGDAAPVNAGTLATTSRAHIATLSLATLSGAAADRFQYARASQTSLDGNTVDMDRERASFADNAVKYEASLRFINGNVRTMIDAIKGQS